MKAPFTSLHMLYWSQNSKYFLRYGRMTIAVWELSLVPGTVPPRGQFFPPTN